MLCAVSGHPYTDCCNNYYNTLSNIHSQTIGSNRQVTITKWIDSALHGFVQ